MVRNVVKRAKPCTRCGRLFDQSQWYPPSARKGKPNLYFREMCRDCHNASQKERYKAAVVIRVCERTSPCKMCGVQFDQSLWNTPMKRSNGVVAYNSYCRDCYNARRRKKQGQPTERSTAQKRRAFDRILRGLK